MPSPAHGIIKGIEERDREFFKAVRGEDDLGFVVRAHIHIEHELREFVRCAAPALSQYIERDFSYERTVRLALILGLSTDLEGGLLYVGKLRNRFAHKLDATLGKSDADNLYDAIGDRAVQFVDNVFDGMRKENSGFPAKFRDLAPRDQLIFMIISLRSAILGEHLVRLRPNGLDSE